MNITIREYPPLSTSGGSIGATLVTPDAWGAMRMNSEETVFSIPPKSELWVAKAMRNEEVRPRAAAIVRLARELGVHGITSLEFHIKRLVPDLRLTNGDYAPAGVTRLREVFVECSQVRQFDMQRSDWHDESDPLLLHRVDAEFDDRQWRELFGRITSSGISRVLFVPSEFLNRHETIQHALRVLKSRIRRGYLVFCGWLRTKEVFPTFWRGHYRLEREVAVGALTGFLFHLDVSTTK